MGVFQGLFIFSVSVLAKIHLQLTHVAIGVAKENETEIVEIKEKSPFSQFY